jgi:hypothetical protein
VPRPSKSSPAQPKKAATIVVERLAGRALVEKPIDPRQSGLFDAYS